MFAELRLLKFGSVAVLVFSGAAVLVLALAPLGSRLGWWHYSFGLYWLMPSSGFIAAIVVILSVVTLTLGWSQLRLRGRIMLSVTLLLGAALAYVPWHYHRIRSSLPPIHDITTDTDNPPSFHAVLPARTAENAGSVAYGDPQLPELQRKAYPDLAPIKSALPVAKAFDRALYVANTMPGWTIVASNPDAGRIEASQQSRWFQFTDDIVIRITSDAAGSRIDMRSTSRQGQSDYGVNAARVRAYMVTLRNRLG
jgi:uncharacterized protein (DUF1499 family)